MDTNLQPVLDAVAGALDSRDGNARRLFHGRGHCFAGLEFITVDSFDSLLWLVLFREPPAQAWAQFTAQLHALAGEHWSAAMVQHRYSQGAPSLMLWGQLPEPAVAREGRWRFQLQPGARQNIGYFMDMSPGREWLAERVEGRRVLNLFAYTCAFSVTALGCGAEAVVNIDMSRASLEQGRENHRLNGQQQALDRVTFLPHNLFRSWKRVRQLGPYDVIIIDPPSRHRASGAALMRKKITSGCCDGFRSWPMPARIFSPA